MQTTKKRVVALVSGGKDSCYAMALAAAEGYEVVALANLLPGETQPDELDSYMYQTVGHQLVTGYAACSGLPLFRRRITGRPTAVGLEYPGGGALAIAGDEVEDLHALLSAVVAAMPGIVAVTSGAIASDYQRLRVEAVCSRLGLISLAYMWRQPQRQLMHDMVNSGLHAILVKVAALGLEPSKHLGYSIAQLQPHLLRIADRFGCNVCGEGGEYETMTLDCPLFSRGRIVLEDQTIVTAAGGDSGGVSPVAYLQPIAWRIQPKAGWAAEQLVSDIRDVPTSEHVPMVEHQQCISNAIVSNDKVAPTARCPPAFTVQLQAYGNGEHVQVWCQANVRTASMAAGARAGAPLLGDAEAAVTAAALHTALQHLEETLPALHMSLRHTLFVQLYLPDMAHFGAANAAYCRHFPALRPPSRACVQLPLAPGCNVMLEVLLAHGAADAAATGTPGSSTTSSAVAAASTPAPVRPRRRVLHVQSVSHWAPSCIGPYSQANSHGGLVHMAGQIGLDPGSMTLVPGGALAEVRRCLDSCEAVAVALRCTLRGAALGVVVYSAPAATRSAAETDSDVEQAVEDFIYSRTAGGGPCSTKGDRSGGSDEGEVPQVRLDPYLVPPPCLPQPLQPAVVYLRVSALPRGALVEVQPLLVDLASPPPTTDLDSDDEDKGQPVGPAGAADGHAARRASSRDEAWDTLWASTCPAVVSHQNRLLRVLFHLDAALLSEGAEQLLTSLSAGALLRNGWQAEDLVYARLWYSTTAGITPPARSSHGSTVDLAGGAQGAGRTALAGPSEECGAAAQLAQPSERACAATRPGVGRELPRPEAHTGVAAGEVANTCSWVPVLAVHSSGCMSCDAILEVVAAKS